MLNRRVTLKPRYDLLQDAETYINASKEYNNAIKNNRPMTYANNGSTHWIAYFWRNLPQPELERIMQEDGLALDIIRTRYNLGAL